MNLDFRILLLNFLLKPRSLPWYKRQNFIEKLSLNKDKVIGGFATRHTHHFGFNIVEGFNGYGFYRKTIDYNKLKEI